MLANPTALESELLDKFRYQKNVALLHTDPRFMPRNRRCWAAWNYRIDSRGRHSTHYWMNELQGVSEREQSGRTVYRVRVGPFDKREDAELTKQKLEGLGMETALVRVQR